MLRIKVFGERDFHPGLPTDSLTVFISQGKTTDVLCLAGVIIRMIFNSHLKQNVGHILTEAGDVESRWSVFPTSIIEAADQSCGCKVAFAYSGGNPQIWGGVMSCHQAEKKSYGVE